MIDVCHNIIFFFSSRRRHTRCGRDWSSDVCSSDLVEDDERLADLTREYLESNGLTVSLETHGGAAVERIRNEQPDLVVRSEERRVGKECRVGWGRVE